MPLPSAVADGKVADSCSASLDEHLKYLKDVLPAGNLCPTSVDEAKKVMFPLDPPYIRYHACINDCIIYRKEHAEKTSCPVCNAS